MRLTYETDVIREKIAGEPFLIEGEEIIEEGKIGLPPSMIIISIIVCFFPPIFIGWGVLLFGAVYWMKGKNGVWLTNKRVVSFTRVPFSKQYSIQSYPLHQISRIRMKRVSDGYDFLDRIFRIGDIQIFVKDQSIVQGSITDLKKIRPFMRKIEEAIEEIGGGEEKVTNS